MKSLHETNLNENMYFLSCLSSSLNKSIGRAVWVLNAVSGALEAPGPEGKW